VRERRRPACSTTFLFEAFILEDSNPDGRAFLAATLASATSSLLREFGDGEDGTPTFGVETRPAFGSVREPVASLL
jgi:hypothetical protein